MNMMRIGATLVASVSMMALAAPVHAADQPEPPKAPTVEDIVVTGSRTVSNGNNSPTPLTVVSTDNLLKSQPSNIADALNNLPIFSGSRSQTSQAIATGPNGGGNGAANELNLRNMGANRTLVLMDGQRVPTATFSGVVDVDLMPEMLIKRVDMVTGGVSAVYGSDAVTGVVNFVTDKTFTGLKLEAQQGISTYGDDPSYKVGIAYGTYFAGGRGHFEASFTRYDDRGITSSVARGYIPASLGGSGTAASPYYVNPNGRLSNYSFGGLITSGPLAGQSFNQNGVLSSTNPGAYTDQGLKSPLDNNQIFARVDYDLSDNIKFHAQGVAEFKTNDEYNTNSELTGVSISATNPYLSSAIQAELAAAGTSSFTMNKVLTDLPLLINHTNEHQFYLNTGIDGKSGGLDWGIDVDLGHTVVNDTMYNDINQQKLAAALDATTNAAGQIVCASAAVNPGCVPLDIFGPTASSQAALKYITDTVNERITTNLYDVNAHIGGSPFSTWAGPVKVALSGEWRHTTLAIVADDTGYANCTDLTSNCTSTTKLEQNAWASLNEVSETVSEVAGEVTVPLLKDSVLGRSLDVNGAARYTDYNVSGKYWTWKGGFNWRVINAITFRGTVSRDIRAPTLYDLFQPATTVPLGREDLLTGQTQTVPSINLGNSSLKAEVGHTATLGVVVKPEFVRGFSFSVDYFHMTVDNAILNIQGWNNYLQDACYKSGGSSSYCALQVRPDGYTDTAASNTVTTWYAEAMNIAQVETMGADIETNYQTRIKGHPVAFRLFASYQPHIYYRQPGVQTIDMGDAAGITTNASPSWRLTGTIDGEVAENVALELRERWRNSMRMQGDPTLYFTSRLPSIGYTDVNLTAYLDKDHKKEFFLNVTNLFNAMPPLYTTSTSPGQSYALGDDPIGRYFTVGLRAKF
jgi:iron complex outermembrane recepter protein